MQGVAWYVCGSIPQPRLNPPVLPLLLSLTPRRPAAPAPLSIRLQMMKSGENMRAQITIFLREHLPVVWQKSGGALAGHAELVVFPGPDNKEIVNALLGAVYTALPATLLATMGCMEPGPILRTKISPEGATSRELTNDADRDTYSPRTTGIVPQAAHSASPAMLLTPLPSPLPQRGRRW